MKEDDKKAAKFRIEIGNKILKAQGPTNKDTEKKSKNEILDKKLRIKLGKGGHFLQDENDENWSIDS